MKTKILSILLLAAVSVNLTGCFAGRSSIVASQYGSKPYDIYLNGNPICRLGSDEDCTVQTRGTRAGGQLEAYMDGQRVNKPGLGYRSSNMSQERTRILKRIEEIKRLQAAPATETSGEGWNLYEDTEAGRICFEFDGKPEQEIINELKHNGFKWSPSRKRWQRQNTDNGRNAADRIKEILTA